MKIHQLKIDFNVTERVRRFVYVVTSCDNDSEITELVDQVCDNLNMPMLKENPVFARTAECLREGQL